MATFCYSCKIKLSFRNSFVWHNKDVCRTCLSKLEYQHKKNLENHVDSSNIFEQINDEHFTKEFSKKENIDNEKKRNKSRNRIILGILLIAFGIIMTILSIEKSDTTGEYYIYWGAIVFGIIDLIVGLTGWVSVKGEKENIQIAEYECTDCGADLTENDQVCPKCGADVSTLDENI